MNAVTIQIQVDKETYCPPGRPEFTEGDLREILVSVMSLVTTTLEKFAFVRFEVFHNNDAITGGIFGGSSRCTEKK